MRMLPRPLKTEKAKTDDDIVSKQALPTIKQPALASVSYQNIWEQNDIEDAAIFFTHYERLVFISSKERV
ncbi:hypothetical protein HBI45_095620 [Parastagonospora nodorum]|nr:hypothetical protein HBI45_095620 [Parastagonospora nodorum]